MDVMKLDNVQPLPLEFNGYVEGTLDLLLGGGNGLSKIKLLKHLQKVCIVSGNAEDPIELEDGDDDVADGGGAAGLQDNGGNDGESPPGQLEDGGGPQESEGGRRGRRLLRRYRRSSGGYPDRPNKWMHPYLLTCCLVGRPSSSEDPDLRTARKTSGPKGRGGKQKAKKGSPSTSDGSGSETSGAYTEVDLSSSAIRMFAGGGEIQSRAQVKKEHAAVAAANAQEQAEQARRVQQAHTGKLVTAVEALSAAVVSRQALDEEAAHRARWDYARLANKA
ncbi:unnamed protein product [Ectocarpus sp. CCAP 1310/34]|nr:unnamed protein product [Ectocarpus sp. CCAP 1310/34]